MTTDYALLSTIPTGLLIVIGILMCATIGSFLGFVFSNERKQSFLRATMVFCVLLLMISAACLALALR